jgi:Secretion system C-terminal sorting domain
MKKRTILAASFAAALLLSAQWLGAQNDDFVDANNNGIPDVLEQEWEGTPGDSIYVIDDFTDANGNGIPDIFENQSDFADTDGNGIPDEWEITWEGGPTDTIIYQDDFSDLNGNGIPDEFEFDPENDPYYTDTNGNGIPDGCEVLFDDANGNGVPDVFEVDSLGGDYIFIDTNQNGVPDELEYVYLDENSNGIPDEIEGELDLTDADANGIPDIFEIDYDEVVLIDENQNGIPDEFENFSDENGNGIPDEFENDDTVIIYDLNLTDADGNGIPDELDELLSWEDMILTEEGMNAPGNSTNANNENEGLSNEMTQAFSLVSCYPNPTKDRCILALQTNEDQIVQIDVISMTGALVSNQLFKITEGSNQIELDFSSLAKGNYIVSAKTNKGIKTMQIVRD